jgi:hypothetical protein
MRLIHAGGFSKAEKKSWKNVIFHNLVDAFLLCFEILLAHGDHVQDAKSEVNNSNGTYGECMEPIWLTMQRTIFIC